MSISRTIRYFYCATYTLYITPMPGIDIRCAIFAAVVFFLHAIVAIGATTPLVSPLNAEVDSPTQINQPSPITQF